MLASSSMSRILGCDLSCTFLHSRQDNAKGRAATDLSLILERTAMLLDNARRNRQAQPGAGLFGGEERVEEALLYFQRDTLAGVNHLQNDHGSGVTLQGHLSASRAECKRAVPSDAFRRVLNDVDQHLFDLLWVNSNPQGR